MVRPRSLAMLAGLAVLLAACASGTSPLPSSSSSPAPTASGSMPSSGSPAPSPAASAAAAELILRVTNEGGFIDPSASIAAIPAVSVYSDGRILTPGAVDAIYPGPLLTPVSVRDVGAAGAAAIIGAIRSAGLDQSGGSGGGPAGDVGTTVFTVTLDGSTVTTRVPGMAGGPMGPGAGSPDPVQAAALDLLSRLTDPTDTWGSPLAPETSLRPTGYRVFVAPGAPVPQGGLSPEPTVVWPLATPLATFGSPAPADRGVAGLRVGVVDGTDAATLGPVLAGATSVTGFTSGGQTYTLYVRPLLPDETGG
jgi:hypothetical protein